MSRRRKEGSELSVSNRASLGTIRYKGLRPFVKYTSSHYPFKIWREEPLMPRFDDRFLDCSVYLYRTTTEAKLGENIGGSGFLAVVDGLVAGEFSAENETKSLHYYAISNRHVVKKSPVVRLNKHDGTTDVIPLSQDDWIWTEDQDVAAAPISYNQAHKYLFVSVASRFLTTHVARQVDVGIGDEVFMVGRLVNHTGKQQNSPSLRWGHISMMPFEPVYHASNRRNEQESFLVEIHSLSGYSGAPVFVRPFSTEKLFATLPPTENPRTAEEEFKQYFKQLPVGPWLLGVEWGYINNHDQRENNTGISGVVPAWHIAELLNCEKLKAQRAEERQEQLKRANEGGTTLTSDESSSQPISHGLLDPFA